MILCGFSKRKENRLNTFVSESRRTEEDRQKRVIEGHQIYFLTQVHFLDVPLLPEGWVRGGVWGEG